MHPKRGGSFQRKELLQYFIDRKVPIRQKSVDARLRSLIADDKIERVGHGAYKLSDDFLPGFLYSPSQFEKSIYAKLRKSFPFLDICIWNPSVLSSLMLHVPDIGYIFVDVEKEGMLLVFHALQSMDMGRNILLSPSATDCERYLTGTDSIVVRQLIGRSPAMEVDDCKVPLIEKMLVDSVGDTKLNFAGGSEIFNIFETAMQRYSINLPKMLTYASRRNRKEKILQILKTIGHDKSTEQIS